MTVDMAIATLIVNVNGGVSGSLGIFYKGTLMNAVLVGRVFGGTLFALSVAQLAAVAIAAPITQPAGLNAGVQYRLIFVTSGGIKGRVSQSGPSNISGYNTFATDQANLQSELVNLGTTWTALVSYTNPSNADGGTAVTNTSTSAGTGLPIYNLNGELVASTYTQLWSQSSTALTNPVRYTQAGTATGSAVVWTGGSFTGGRGIGRGLGNPDGGYQNVGVPTSTLSVSNGGQNGAWFSGLIQGVDPNTIQTSQLPIYVMSGTLVAVPEPSSMALAGLGAIGAGIGAIRRRSRRTVA